MSLPDSVAPDPHKPSRWSLATVLFAILLLIPGLCFGIAWPAKMATVTAVLGMAWIAVLLMWLLVILPRAVRFLVGRIRR